ncbi:YhgE/Pip domain-containing protein [Actinomadura kijaniata]|uniref:Putative membrane protein n=1 Tax=Actinomadura namibiensis TaxID=182080 RepID=A0A7W3LNS8_ACTNM|nr:YhgE/Pip domain-containing protein [Actinomadura namibiensis]MBA8951499.1 putative membrane protein [Actinomadura namibiensis]
MRLPALSTGGLELRRFRRNRLTAIGLVGLVMLPLLYAGLYLWSFWDPYGRLSHLPVALVVEDRPAKADGKQVHAGADLAEELEKRRIFAWKRVDAATADRGVRKGDYYMSLTIPPDFSTRLASPSGDGTPAPAGLRLQLNDSNNYVVGTVAQAAFKEVSAAAREKAIRGYFDQILVSFGTLHGELDKAAKGADKLADGSGKAHEGAGKLSKGLGDARTGAGKLHASSGRLTNGLGALRDGAQQVAAGNQRLAAMVNQASDAVLPLLRENAPEIRDAALLVARGADALADGANRLPAQTRQAVRDAEAARAELRTYLAAHPEIPDRIRQDLLRVSGRVVQVARQVDGYVRAHTAELRKIAADARQVQRLANEVAKNAPTLAARVERARRDVNRLSSGARQVSAGAGKLMNGSARLTTGLGTLQNGLGRLADGSVTLSTALLQISDGSGKLATGLHQGTDKVPDYGEDERAGRADMMSDPVRLASDTDNKVPNYGTGFAPFFVPLALWVGAMLIYMMLRPVNQRAQASNAPGWRVALAGWLPAVAIGIGQVLIVLAVLRFALGLEAANWPGLIALLALASASFLAVVQWVNVKFGPIGRVVALALLMLQLTSAAGTYPIETSPGFFQAIRPFLPMPWTVDAARRLISGGDLTPVWQGGAVLVAFLVGGLLLSALAVRRNRVWTMKRLHPVLKL